MKKRGKGKDKGKTDTIIQIVTSSITAFCGLILLLVTGINITGNVILKRFTNVSTGLLGIVFILISLIAFFNIVSNKK